MKASTITSAMGDPAPSAWMYFWPFTFKVRTFHAMQHFF